MTLAEAPCTERLGPHTLALFFSKKGWLFREQLTQDYGIDAQVEIVTDGQPTGQLIAIQIKSGISFFNERTNKGNYVFRPGSRHVDYWKKHCLPVIVVLYNPDTDEMIWEAVNKTSLLSTGKNWKMIVPHSKTLTENSLQELLRLAQTPSDIQKLNKLRLDKPWMKLIDEGETVYIAFDDWINKTLARFEIFIGCDSRDDIKEQSWPMIFAPGFSPEHALSYVIPWANFDVDEDAYRDGQKDIWDAECYIYHDKEDGITYHSESFHEWYSPPNGLVPCSQNGEIASYRLILSLNEVGKGFLALDEFLQYEQTLLAGTR